VPIRHYRKDTVMRSDKPSRSAYVAHLSMQQAAQLQPRQQAVRELYAMRQRASDNAERNARAWCVVLLALLPTLLLLGL